MRGIRGPARALCQVLRSNTHSCTTFQAESCLPSVLRVESAATQCVRWSKSWAMQRNYSTIKAYQQQVDDVNDAFVAARDEIEYAKEDAESTYFNESFQTAKAAVDKVLEDFNSILQNLEESEKAKLQRSMGLKMEQLKAELQQLEHLHA